MKTALVKRRLFRGLFIQSALGLCVALLFLFSGSMLVAMSVLEGCGVFLIPTWVFAWIAFRHQGARSAKCIVASFYWGEFLKLFVSMALFAAVFMTQKLSVAAFFSAYIVNQVMMIVVYALMEPAGSTKT